MPTAATNNTNETEDDPLLLPSTQKKSRKQKISALFGMRSLGHDSVDPEHDGGVLKFTIQPETFRFYAYCFFWAMAIIAILITRLVTKQRLLDGPPLNSNTGEPSTCPPFQNGVGFDIDTDSHLIKAFGFNNICSNWDYSPSREVIALIYPIFEYTLLLYLVADFINVTIAYRKGWVSRQFWRVFRCLFPLMIVLCSWFRMIFVILAYENVRGHTAGFLGLQITLMLVACLNVYYISQTKIEYDFLGGQRGTYICAIAYLIFAVGSSVCKFYLDVHVVLGFSYPNWGLVTVVSGMVVGQAIDMVWMLFNAVLPLVIAYVRSRSEEPLEVTIDLQPPSYVLAKVDEQEVRENSPITSA